jgi:putative Holliday junction resolvase
MALDVGTKTVGIAVTDPSQTIVSPLRVLRYAGVHEVNKVFDELKTTLIEQDAEKIIVGIPEREDGAESPQAKKIKTFIASFKRFLQKTQIDSKNWEWIFVNEDLSSIEANRLLAQKGVSTKKRKDKLDATAAAIFLQWFLEK